MAMIDVLILFASCAGLFVGGWVFLNRSVYTTYEKRSVTATCLFSVVFTLSALMLELLVFEVTDTLSPRCVLVNWSFGSFAAVLE